MKNIVCKLKGHTFTQIKKAPSSISEYECLHCKQLYTTDGYGRMVKLTKYWQANHQFFEKHFTKQSAS
ncbi:hypothetical protein ATE92_0900 [Ulvibacter sp. MAR_2010_11]|uniref:hypothetical protein n=1 Tax=Ulvibacter sp. MAR_2010_11 TaxID=1250229 RepID=UPI000CA90529|nr:hypothetical protein [Ulvibacter sp. MAR_2010_11]PKA82763.1 hypothetical protein ATE92_0900 [Ulvibacter sp. MAR_2010_11]